MSETTRERQIGPLLAEGDGHDYLTEFFDLSPDGYLITDSDAVIGLVNPAAAALLGEEAERLIGTSLGSCLAEGSQEDLAGFVARLKDGDLGLEGELVLRESTGPLREVKVTVRTGRPADDGRGVLHWALRDVTEHHQQLRRLEYLAYHDQLTGLGNRRLLMMRLRQAIAKASRDHRGLAVIYLDLDRFKVINDHLGHWAGDALLRLSAERLRSATRQAETLGRLGGDEFLLVIEDLDVRDDEGNDRVPPEPELAARRIVAALKSPYELAGVHVYISASLGISLYPTDAEDASTLIARADAEAHSRKRTRMGHPLIAAKDQGTLAAFAPLRVLKHLNGNGGRTRAARGQDSRGRAGWPEVGAKILVESSFAATSEAPGMARTATAAGLKGHPEDVIDIVVLLVSELVTNSVKHAGLPKDGSIKLVLLKLADRIHVEVTDGGRGVRRSDLDTGNGDGHGLGLLLIDRLASAWGTLSDQSGVWFEVEEGSSSGPMRKSVARASDAVGIGTEGRRPAI